MSEPNANPADPGAGGTPHPNPSPDPAPTPAPAPADPPPPQAFDREGWRSQYKNWAESLEDAGHKDMASRFTGPEDLLKLTVEQRKELSTRIKVPGADATDEDKAKFRKAIGVPDKPTDYEVALPDGFELGEHEQPLVEAMRAKALEAGVPKEAFKEFAKAYFELQKSTEDAINSDLKAFAERSQAQLKKEYGAELDGALNAANDLIAKLDVPDFEWLLKQPVTMGKATVQLGNHPGMMQLLAKLGKRGGEALPGGLNLMVTPSDKANARKEIDEIRAANPPGSEGYKSKAVQSRLNELYELVD
jgi:hypothetical protein